MENWKLKIVHCTLYIEIALLHVRYCPGCSCRQFPVDKLLALCPVAMLVVLVLKRILAFPIVIIFPFAWAGCLIAVLPLCSSNNENGISQKCFLDDIALWIVFVQDGMDWNSWTSVIKIIESPQFAIVGDGENPPNIVILVSNASGIFGIAGLTPLWQSWCFGVDGEGVYVIDRVIVCAIYKIVSVVCISCEIFHSSIIKCENCGTEKEENDKDLFSKFDKNFCSFKWLKEWLKKNPQ